MEKISYTRIEEKYGYLLVRRDGTDQYTVVRIDRKRHCVYSAMPTDGEFFSPATDHGIDYVSKLYSYSYARRMFSQLTQQQATWEAAINAP